MNLVPSPYTGFWGDKLFENANDLHVVSLLDHDAGLHELQDAANAFFTIDIEPVVYSIYAPQCSSEEAAKTVRKHLDSEVLAKVAAKQVARYFEPTKVSDFTNHGYTCIISEACAMSLGCETYLSLPGYSTLRFSKLFETYHSFMQGIFETAPIKDEGMAQLDDAFKHFTSGKPYDFGSKSWEEERAAKLASGYSEAEATICWGLFIECKTIQSKSSREQGKGKTGSVIVPDIVKLILDYEHDDACGKCQTKAATLTCGRCKDQVYCGVQC